MNERNVSRSRLIILTLAFVQCANLVSVRKYLGHDFVLILQKTTASIAAKRDGVQLRQGINESDASEIVRRVSTEDADKVWYYDFINVSFDSFYYGFSKGNFISKRHEFFIFHRDSFASNLCERRLLISRLIVVVWDFFFLPKRSGDGDVETAIADEDSCESRPQKADSPVAIHVQENAEASQLQHTEINAILEVPGPKDVRVNETARDVVQHSCTTERSVEKLLTTSKPSASRSENDFEPPLCNCPGIYIFFSSCILIQIHRSFIYFQPAWIFCRDLVRLN